jgi:hypothetical protein
MNIPRDYLLLLRSALSITKQEQRRVDLESGCVRVKWHVCLRTSTIKIQLSVLV